VTPGQLVKATAIALDIPEETIVQHDRNLAVAGLRTTGGRGRNAPAVTHRDAARLIAGVLGSVKVKDCASVVQQLEQTRLFSNMTGYVPLPCSWFSELPDNHSFIDALTAIIESGDNPQMIENFPEFARRLGNLEIQSTRSFGSISFWPEGFAATGFEVPYVPRNTSANRNKAVLLSDLDWSHYYGMAQERTIRGNCLMILAFCFQKGLPASREAVFRVWKSAANKAAA